MSRRATTHYPKMKNLFTFLIIQNFVSMDARLQYQILRHQYSAEQGKHKLDLEKIRKYYQEGGNLNALDDDSSLLMLAASNHKPDIVEFLIKNGVDINLQNSNGNTALCYASLNGCSASTLLLIKAGAKINIFDNDETPLISASRCGHTGIVELLLKYGAEVNSQSKIFQRTAIFYAMIYKHPKIVKLLLRKNADLELKDDERRTAVDVAHPIIRLVLNDYNKLKSLRNENSYLSVVPHDIITLIEDIIFDDHQPQYDPNINSVKHSGHNSDDVIGVIGKVTDLKKWREISPICTAIRDEGRKCWIVTGRIRFGDYCDILTKDYVLSMGLE